MSALKGKKFLIVGLLSEKSIAFGIAKALYEDGAELAFTYQSDRFQDRVKEMAQQFQSQLICPCDVSQDAEIQSVYQYLSQHWTRLDGFVHSVAYAPADQLEGDYINCLNRTGFATAHDISSYSLGALCQALLPMMDGHPASVIALTYLGSTRAVANYNVMGLAKASLEANIRYLAYSLGPRKIRVNGISAGPIKTLAASGIKDFRKMLKSHAQITPLRENVTIEQVGNTAAFLLSERASGITGEIIHVDGGFHMTASTVTEAE